MAKKEQSTPVIVNRKANHLYFIDETFEVGIMLIGSEVKSIRDGKCTLGEAWIDIDESKNEIWLVGAHIDEYLFANRFNHFRQGAASSSPMCTKSPRCARPRSRRAARSFP